MFYQKRKWVHFKLSLFLGVSISPLMRLCCVTHLYLYNSNQQKRHQHFGHTHKTSISYVQVQGNLVSFFFQSFN